MDLGEGEGGVATPRVAGNAVAPAAYSADRGGRVLQLMPSTRVMEVRAETETEHSHDEVATNAVFAEGQEKAFDDAHEVIATSVSNRRLL